MPITAVRMPTISMQEVSPKPLPALLAEWGMDAELWSQIKNKRSLEKLAEQGEEDHGRKRIAKLRQQIAEAPAAPPASAPAAKKKKAAPKRKSAVKKVGPYSLYGSLPDGTDEAAISALVEQRSAAKVSKDYAGSGYGSNQLRRISSSHLLSRTPFDPRLRAQPRMQSGSSSAPWASPFAMICARGT